MELIISAPARYRTAENRLLRPDVTSPPISFAPSTNPCTFVINVLRFVPTSGNVAAIDEIAPPINFPTKLPRASPT